LRQESNPKLLFPFPVQGNAYLLKKIRFRDTISTKMDFLLWKGDDGMRKNKGEKVVKSRAGWKKADQVRKIKIVMTFVVVALCISIAAGAVLAWIEIE